MRCASTAASARRVSSRAQLQLRRLPRSNAALSCACRGSRAGNICCSSPRVNSFPSSCADSATAVLRHALCQQHIEYWRHRAPARCMPVCFPETRGRCGISAAHTGTVPLNSRLRKCCKKPRSALLRMSAVLRLHGVAQAQVIVPVVKGARAVSLIPPCRRYATALVWFCQTRSRRVGH